MTLAKAEEMCKPLSGCWEAVDVRVLAAAYMALCVDINGAEREIESLREHGTVAQRQLFKEKDDEIGELRNDTIMQRELLEQKDRRIRHLEARLSQQR